MRPASDKIFIIILLQGTRTFFWTCSWGLLHIEVPSDNLFPWRPCRLSCGALGVSLGLCPHQGNCVLIAAVCPLAGIIGMDELLFRLYFKGFFKMMSFGACALFGN